MSTTAQSPLAICPEDVQSLDATRPFQMLRNHLAADATNDLCHEHSCCAADNRETWLLHRDILHALITPVVRLFCHASRLAQAALCTSKPEELEMAYTGDARSAFLWLQCFVADEEDWCRLIGCPACVVTSALSTEQHIRLIFIAARLADEANSASSQDHHQQQQQQRSLPALPFFADAFRHSIDRDPFWQSYPGASAAFESSAAKLAAHMHILVEQCRELEALVSDHLGNNATPQTAHTDRQTTCSPLAKLQQRAQPVRSMPSGLMRVSVGESKCPAVKPSRMARRQRRMRQEEQMLLQRLLSQCYAVSRRAHDACCSGDSALSFGERRTRSSTCP